MPYLDTHPVAQQVTGNDETPAENLPLMPLVPAQGGAVVPSGIHLLVCRQHIALQVRWTPTANGVGATLSVLQTSGPGSPRTAGATLAGTSPGTCFAVMPFGERAASVTLTLQLRESTSGGSGSMQRKLVASYPLSESEAAQVCIGTWPITSAGA